VVAAVLVEAIPKLRRLARALTGNAADADDLVQATCVRVLERRKRLSNADGLPGWIVRVMKNINIDAARRPDRKVTSYSEDVLPAPAPQPIARWRLVSDEALAASVSRLPSTSRVAWELTDVRRIDHQDAARRLNVATATVGTRVHRARRALRRMLDERREQASPR
jgi:RNA polymerase sigma-70 factor (ECF subfamily)